MASASRPVGVRLCDTCNAAGAIPAPVRASVTWAVAGFGEPAASRPSASVTVCVTVSVAAASASVAEGAPLVPAPGSAAPLSGAAGPATADDAAVDAAAVACSDAPGWTWGVPPTQPDKPATSAAATVAANKQRAAVGQTVGAVAVPAADARAGAAGAGTEAGAAGTEAARAADTAPAVVFCRLSGVSRIVPFCHASTRTFPVISFMTLADRGAAGGADPARQGTKRVHGR
jgi:hypothetical protein